MSRTGAVAVASHSFSGNRRLREELLAKYPSARFNDTGVPLAGEPLIRFLGGHEKAISGLEVLDDRLFRAVPELRLVSKYGVGLDTLDLAAARRHNVVVRWTPGVNSQAVAELAVAFMVVLLRDIIPLVDEVRGGQWPHHRTGRQLSSAVVGILGCGHVGQRVTRICRAFGARVLVHDIRAYEAFYREVGARPVPLEVLLREADIVTIHTPLDRSTRGLIGAAELGLMKPTALLVNTARGGIVDERALKAALIAKQITGAAFDVFAEEPPADPELVALRNFIATPHIGGGTEDAVLAMGRAAIAGLDAGAGSIDLTAGYDSPIP